MPGDAGPASRGGSIVPVRRGSADRSLVAKAAGPAGKEFHRTFSMPQREMADIRRR